LKIDASTSIVLPEAPVFLKGGGLRNYPITDKMDKQNIECIKIILLKHIV